MNCHLRVLETQLDRGYKRHRLKGLMPCSIHHLTMLTIWSCLLGRIMMANPGHLYRGMIMLTIHRFSRGNCAQMPPEDLFIGPNKILRPRCLWIFWRNPGNPPSKEETSWPSWHHRTWQCPKLRVHRPWRGLDGWGDGVRDARLLLNSSGCHQNESSEHAKTIRKWNTWRVRWLGMPWVPSQPCHSVQTNHQAPSARPWNSRPLGLGKRHSDITGCAAYPHSGNSACFPELQTEQFSMRVAGSLWYCCEV